MSSKIQSIGIIDQRISGNSRYFLIWLGKTTVNHDNLYDDAGADASLSQRILRELLLLGALGVQRLLAGDRL